MPTSLASTALRTLLTEAFQGGKPKWAWFLNQTDPGLIGVLKSISAREASTPPGPDRSTIAAHATHVLYHLELIERLLKGEPNVFQTADWSAAWKVSSVDDAKWRSLIDKLETLAKLWIESCDKMPEDEMAVTGAFASPVHFAYHLGAIRQILLTVRESK